MLNVKIQKEQIEVQREGEEAEEEQRQKPRGRQCFSCLFVSFPFTFTLKVKEYKED